MVSLGIRNFLAVVLMLIFCSILIGANNSESGSNNLTNRFVKWGENVTYSSTLGLIFINEKGENLTEDRKTELRRKVRQYLGKAEFQPVYDYTLASDTCNYRGSTSVIENMEPLCCTKEENFINMTQDTDEVKNERMFSAKTTCSPYFCKRFKESLRRQEEDFCSDSTFKSGNFEVDEENTQCLTDWNPIKTEPRVNDICLCAFKDFGKLKVVGYLIHEVQIMEALKKRGLYHYMRLADYQYEDAADLTHVAYTFSHLRARIHRIHRHIKKDKDEEANLIEPSCSILKIATRLIGGNKKDKQQDTDDRKDYYGLIKLYDLNHPQKYSNCKWGIFVLYPRTD